ncbi:MAG: hypothetical protein IT198_07275 [Acidimicrobiia bacterium]|nr:hypothetical protein [Acidimicrobiia bacterium]
MTGDAAVWVVAVLEVVAAAVIVTFWITWFRDDHDAAWLPAGYVDHETPFVFSDSVLALLLVAGAVLQVFEEPLGRSLGLVSAGMLAFLGILDTAYFARTGMFARDRDGAANLAIVVAVLVLAVILFVRFA